MLRVLVPPPSRLDVLKVTIFCILNYIVYEMLHPVQYLHLRWDGNTFASQIPLWVNQQQKKHAKQKVSAFVSGPACVETVSHWSEYLKLRGGHKGEAEPNTREPLGTHIRSFEVLKIRLRNLNNSFWLDRHVQRTSCVHPQILSHFAFSPTTLVSEWENLWVPGYMLQWETHTKN